MNALFDVNVFLANNNQVNTKRMYKIKKLLQSVEKEDNSTMNLQFRPTFDNRKMKG